MLEWLPSSPGVGAGLWDIKVVMEEGQQRVPCSVPHLPATTSAAWGNELEVWAAERGKQQPPPVVDVFWWDRVPGVPGRQGKATVGVLQQSSGEVRNWDAILWGWATVGGRKVPALSWVSGHIFTEQEIRPAEYFNFNFVGTERPEFLIYLR